MIAVVKDDSRLYSFNKTMFRVLQCAEIRPGFGQNQKPETGHDTYSLCFTHTLNKANLGIMASCPLESSDDHNQEGHNREKQ